MSFGFHTIGLMPETRYAKERKRPAWSDAQAKVPKSRCSTSARLTTSPRATEVPANYVSLCTLQVRKIGTFDNANLTIFSDEPACCFSIGALTGACVFGWGESRHGYSATERAIGGMVESPAAQLEIRPSDRPLHIALIVPGLAAGGCERAVTLIANAWAGRGWRVTIITLERPETVPYFSLAANVETLRLGMPTGRTGALRSAWLFARRVWLLRKELRRLSPDVAISFLTRMNVLSILATLQSSIPVVVSERNNPGLQTFGPFWETLRGQLYPHAFGLVTLTKGAMDRFPPEQRARSWVIPNEANLPAGLQPCRGKKTLTAVGRLVPQKGFDLLLDAFARISDAHADWTLVIWGEGPERARLEKKRDALGLRGRVHLPGVTRQPGLWVETADVFVLSSRYEGWGAVLLEAMAAGLPVVSFDCDYGPRDMITDGKDGLLVAPGDIDALSAALSRLLINESLRDRLAGAAKVSACRFSPERVMARWDEVVQSALDHSKFRSTRRRTTERVLPQKVKSGQGAHAPRLKAQTEKSR